MPALTPDLRWYDFLFNELNINSGLDLAVN